MDTTMIEGLEQDVERDVRGLLHNVESGAEALVSYCDLEQFSLIFAAEKDQLLLDVELQSNCPLPSNTLVILRDGKAWHTVTKQERTNSGARIAMDEPLAQLQSSRWQAQLSIDGQDGDPMVTDVAVLLQASNYTGDQRFPEQQLPEFSDRLDYGLCFSGGGSRSMALSIGQMRGLKQLGLLEKAGYTSSVSGGSWAATVFSYQGNIEDTGKLIGASTPPENLAENDAVPPALQGNEKHQFLAQLAINLIGAACHSIGDHFPLNRLTESLIRALLDDERCRSWDRVWIDTVGGAFLKPLELFAAQQPDKDLFTLDAGDVAAIRDSNPVLAPGALTVLRNPQGNMPYPIVNSAIGGPVELQGKYQFGRYVGYEYTPLYAGPCYDGSVSWNETGDHAFDFAGSQLQSFGQNSVPVPLSNAPDLICSPWYPLSLTTMTGTSSAAFAGLVTSSMYSWNSILALLGSNDAIAAAVQRYVPGLSHLPAELFAMAFRKLISFIASKMPLKDTGLELQPQATIWNRERAQAPVNMNFLDGGNIENYGLMAMLRRKVKRVVVFINTYQPFCWQDSYSSVTPESMDSSLPALFGAFSQQQLHDMQASEGIDASHNQVFATDELDPLAQQLRDIRFAAADKIKPDHGALIARSKHSVQKNDWWQIEGGWEVEVLWVYNAQTPAWEQRLQPDVAKALKDDSDGLGAFPVYNTIRSTLEGMTPLQINALASLGEWTVTDNASQFEAMFNA